MPISRLCIFDFDGTLFRSPERPAWWKHKGWWTDRRSLEPPCVPEKPEEVYWVSSTVEAVLGANAAEETYSVLLTGRIGPFEDRLKTLLKQKKLEFDEIGLTDEDDSQAFKVKQIRRLLREHPDVKLVEQWEDRRSQIRPYRAVVENAGVDYKVHIVESKPMVCPETVEKVARRWLSREIEPKS